MREKRKAEVDALPMPNASAGMDRGHRSSARRRLARPSQCQKFPTVRVTGKFCGELFVARCGIVSKAVRNMCFKTREWELLRGTVGDPTSVSVLRSVRQIISKGDLLAAFLAPPCGSFSFINSSVRRPSADPWGLGPQQSERARASINIGDRCMKSAIKIINWSERERIPWILEHPLTSRAWYLPSVKQFLRRSHIVACDLDQCQYGTRWRKSTRLITTE